MNPAEICEVREGGIAKRYGIKAGDRLVSINGRPLLDILDYQLGIVDEEITLEIMRDGVNKTVLIENPALESLGILFSTSLFDGIKTCANKCVFCFIDQLPPKMRKEVYVKDDDYRLSFLYGNFVTLTNTRDEEIARIIRDRISPIYVSLHATKPTLRTAMLGRKKDDKALEYIKRLSVAGIELHIQMVMCPGLNDRDELERSIRELSKEEYGGVASVGLVPVGLTNYRNGLYPLRSFEKQEIIYLVEQIRRWQERFEQERGYAWVYIADEFYIEAGYGLPRTEHYAGFPQIENGIGLSRLFIDEVEDNLERLTSARKTAKMAVATGKLFSNIMREITDGIEKNYGLKIAVIEVENSYFGGAVNVTGLLTGSDLVTYVGRWLQENERIDRLLVPDVVLNGNGLMLDDYSPVDVASQLGVEVIVVKSSGTEFIDDIIEASRETANGIQ